MAGRRPPTMMPAGFLHAAQAPAHRFAEHPEALGEVAPVEGPVGVRRIGEAHGEEEHRFQEGEAHRGGEPEGELPEELADDAADEADGDENGRGGRASRPRRR